MRPEDSAQPGEIWRPVVGYEADYAVSSLCRVRRASRGRGTYPGKILKPFAGEYYSYSLMRDGRRRTHRLQVMVAEAFLGPRPEGSQVNHKDGNKLNCCPANLEYCTPSENAKHAVYVLGIGRGESHCSAKLTAKDILAIRDRLKRGEVHREIAGDFAVHPSMISKIACGTRWRHLD